MKLIKNQPVNKTNNSYTAMSQKLTIGIMLANYDIIGIFWIYGQFGAIHKPDSGRIV